MILVRHGSILPLKVLSFFAFSLALCLFMAILHTVILDKLTSCSQWAGVLQGTKLRLHALCKTLCLSCENSETDTTMQ